MKRQILRTPSGRYIVVGRVPSELAFYHAERGGPLTSEEVTKVQRVGPGFFPWCRTRSWPTYEEARAAVVQFQRNTQKSGNMRIEEDSD